MQQKAKQLNQKFWANARKPWKIVTLVALTVVCLLIIVDCFSGTDNIIEYGNFRAKAPHYTWLLAKPTKKNPKTETQLSTKKKQITFPHSVNSNIVYVNHTKYHMSADDYGKALKETHYNSHCYSLSSLESLNRNDDIFELKHGHKLSLLIQEYRVR